MAIAPREPGVIMDAEGAISDDTFASLRHGFVGNPAYRIAQNAVTQASVDEIAVNRSIVTNMDHTFSIMLDDWAVTNQKQSGRCWMFAGLNLLRVSAMRKMGIKEFEFSQNYTLFWDKLERANYFYEGIIETSDRDVDDRLVAFLLDGPLGDGGQWNMFVNLVKRHGLVPKAFMPETESSSNTRRLNAVLRSKLREGAQAIRECTDGIDAQRAIKQEYLEVIYRILSVHLGTPPETFVWQWKDRDGEFHRTEEMTPQQFATEFVEWPLDEYVCLVNDPRPSSPYGRTFTVQYLGNVVGGAIVKYLNVDIALMKRITQQSLEAGEPVWFGCDVGKQMHRTAGMWDKALFDYATLYDSEFTLDKASRLIYHESQMTHAMLFTGVDVVDGEPKRWRVENSWGDANGQKGFFVMNDNWYAEHMFEIAARKSSLPADLQAALDQEPIVLPAWDPMGALAR
jgi:bleomycin hydrolase